MTQPLAYRLLCLLVLTGGCVRFTVGRLALVSMRPGELRPGAAGQHVGARSCVPLLFVFPAGPLPNLGHAFDDALAAGNGSVMRDVRVRFEMLYVPFVFGFACYVVEGDVS